MNNRSFLATLESHKRAVAMRRLAMLRPVGELARIFRAMIGDPEAQKGITVGEVQMYQPAETFGEFLRVNRLPCYEETLR